MINNFAGRHLIVDGISNNIDKISSIGNITDYLYKVTEETDMTLVYPPIASKFPFSGELTKFTNNLKKEGIISPTLTSMDNLLKFRDMAGGVSAISIWLESHLAVHTWSESMYVSLDLFSCKNYDIDPVIELSKKYFDFSHVSILNVERYIGKPQIINSFEIDYVGGELR
jgi:S-adenosylmethionine decarboxylase